MKSQKNISALIENVNERAAFPVAEGGTTDQVTRTRPGALLPAEMVEAGAAGAKSAAFLHG